MKINILSLVFLFSLIFNTSGIQAQSYLALADSAYKCISNERYADAEEFLLKALHLEPDNYSNHLLLSNLSAVRLNLNNPQGALESAEIGLAMAPASTQLLMNHALANIAVGNTDGALEDTAKALEVDSTHIKALNIHGMILLKKGKYEAAEKFLKRLVRYDAENADALVALGRISEIKNSMSEAIGYYTKATEIEPTPETLFYRIMALAEYGKDSEAETILRETLKQYPHDGNLYIAKAYLSKKSYQIRETELNLELAKQYGADSELLSHYFPPKK